MKWSWTSGHSNALDGSGAEDFNDKLMAGDAYITPHLGHEPAVKDDCYHLLDDFVLENDVYSYNLAFTITMVAVRIG